MCVCVCVDVIRQVNSNELNKLEDFTDSPIHSHKHVLDLDLIEWIE